MNSIVFVYNADSGLLNGLKDLVHKWVSPSTYPCSLCDITYNSLGMLPRWKSFVQGIGIPVEFLHKDELENEYGRADVELPAAFTKDSDGALELWIDADTMNGFHSLDELMAFVEERISPPVP
jgi:hypothetical protein